jgi:hypothetical protein
VQKLKDDLPLGAAAGGAWVSTTTGNPGTGCEPSQPFTRSYSRRPHKSAPVARTICAEISA